jgi:hypothetical protein
LCLVRRLFRLRCLRRPLLLRHHCLLLLGLRGRRLLRLRCLRRPLLLRRRCLLLLGLRGLRGRRLLLLDRRRIWGFDRTTASGWLWVGLVGLTVWAHGLVALDFGDGGVVGSAGRRPVLSAVIPGLVLRTGSSWALWTRRAGASRCTLTPLRVHFDAGG